eukprot:545926-Prymnesium_polylepis.1
MRFIASPLGSGAEPAHTSAAFDASRHSTSCKLELKCATIFDTTADVIHVTSRAPRRTAPVS